MEKNEPLVSVIIPLYNAANYIKDCIESIKNQTYNNIEVIIVDDGSIDNSYEIVKKELSYSCLQYTIIRQKNLGASAARNKGIQTAKGMYIMFLDADDIIAPQKIEEQILHLRKYSFDSLITAFGGWETLDGKEKMPVEIQHDYNNPLDLIIDLFLYHTSVLIHCYLVHKDLVKKTLWDTDLTLDDDGEYFARIISLSKKIIFCNSSISYYRQDTPGSLSKTLSEKAILSQVKAAISKSELLKFSSNPNKTKAIYQGITSKIHFYYPYFSYPRKIAYAYLRVNYPQIVISTPKVSFRIWCYYYLSKIRLIKKVYPL